MIKIKPRNIAINIKLIIYLYNEPRDSTTELD